jgi:arylsulfatase A
MIRAHHFLVPLARVFPIVGLLNPASGGESGSRAPNVILIYTDDQGSMDLGCYGASDLVTPHTDALAAQGIRLTQMYAASAVCSPSRAALLTGRQPGRTSVSGNVGSGSAEGLKGVPTLAQTLKKGGYATALFGKWHLGSGPTTNPQANGFDDSFGHLGGCIDNYSHFYYWSGPNRHDLWKNGEEVFRDGRYFPDLVTEEVEGFIDRHVEQPFFLYVAFNTPHYPYQGEQRWIEHYQKAGVKYPRDLYAASVSTQDERIGRIIAMLEKRGIRDDTIIVFQSDHGHSVEERAHFGGGSAGPSRGAKFSLLEGGIRVPSIISYPKRLPQGEARNQMVSAMDWLPTLAELCGVKLLDPDLDGRSMVRIFESEDAPEIHQTLYWQMGKQWAVREGPWKLITHPINPVANDPLSKADLKEMLVNLDVDPEERHNLIKDHPEKAKALGGLRPAWARE